MRHLLNTLFVSTQGAWLSKDGENIVVHLDRDTTKRYPIHILESVVCFGDVNATHPLMGFCAEKGVALTYLDEHGRFIARMQGPVRGNVLLRRQQYRLADDGKATIVIARNMLIGKISNSRAVLLRAARETRDGGTPNGARSALSVAAKYLGDTVKDLDRPLSLDVLRGKEGDAARHYFDVFDHMIVAQKEHFRFTERNRRPPTDNVNALLSYVYSLLTNDIESALEGVGLDPAVGYLHRERPGRPSLALDMMEEFRSWLADRLVLSLINLKQVRPDGFSCSESGAVMMSGDTKKAVLNAWHERKQDELTHPYLGEKMAIGLLPHMQARLLARHIRGDLASYPPFVWK
ncbi:MAG: type I-C CRISPR-associated endonuclease Cas1c [Synergistaceae bacterium]|jgi:CRISPR-associated protein Cas1|nr:type I-C CRISPR-associated endonuclease Cas1c [Synergistaceae bacterium]